MRREAKLLTMVVASLSERHGEGAEEAVGVRVAVDAVMAGAVYPQQEQALLKQTAPEQALASVATGTEVAAMKLAHCGSRLVSDYVSLYVSIWRQSSTSHRI
jgi:hypothetical protein